MRTPQDIAINKKKAIQSMTAPLVFFVFQINAKNTLTHKYEVVCTPEKYAGIHKTFRLLLISKKIKPYTVHATTTNIVISTKHNILSGYFRAYSSKAMRNKIGITSFKKRESWDKKLVSLYKKVRTFRTNNTSTKYTTFFEDWLIGYRHHHVNIEDKITISVTEYNCE
ncbi:hypothetical protein MNBD_GAMMA17-807 [hydrothermal vent metagenome]|uniref:Uncharacterized protein n=1 Tax=hydrothermal vent metagenome TaxID=652676 RepID=A0A3B0Z998_9ZZZZ